MKMRTQAVAAAGRNQMKQKSRLEEAEEKSSELFYRKRNEKE